MAEYYDPDGKPIGMDEWVVLFEKRSTDPDTSWWNRKTKVGDAEVSTVWLGLNHQWFPDGPPLFWESMIFGGDHDEEQRRYSSREDAWKGHEELVKSLQ